MEHAKKIDEAWNAWKASLEREKLWEEFLAPALYCAFVAGMRAGITIATDIFVPREGASTETVLPVS